MSQETHAINLPPHMSLAAKSPQNPTATASSPVATNQAAFSSAVPSTHHLPFPPFIPVSGVPNFRDLGGYPCAPLPGSSALSSIRTGYLFRCAQLTLITEAGITTLTAPPPEGLGIHQLYDLRSQPELSAQPTPLDIPGITRSFTPVYREEDYSPVALATKYRWYTSPDEAPTADDHSEGFVNAYRDIALHGGPTAYRTICRHIIDHPDQPFIFHCTAGKDRTGVLAGLLLDLCGVDREVIAWEYAITAAGLGPWREVIIKRLMEGGTTVNSGGSKGTGMTREEAERIGGSRRGNMRVFLRDVVDKEFGGARKYFEKRCGFSEEEVERLRANLVVEEEGKSEIVDIPGLS